MTVRVIFISPAIGAALRQARFDDDGPLDEGGLRSAQAAAPALPAADRALVSPSTRCRQTADALGLAAAEEAPALRGCAMGRWRGRTLDEVSAEEPEAVLAWLTDPAAAPHGGESVRQLCARVAEWLDGAAELTGRLLVVAEPDVIRAAALHALGAPEQAFWRLDVPPLSTTELTGRAARWNLRLSASLTRPGL
ncbi:histidine phosphatase family protein [Kitasatospora sp. NPDC097643]|uniref:histidine phosphatase family protein n=1 Tax=Kitasatospora sp. NPDC097643 TaxID=3157230 RepID=UPI00332830BA